MNGIVPPYPYGATEPSEEWLQQQAQAVTEFQKVFGDYFPRVRKDRDAAEEAALLLMFGSMEVPGEVVNQAEALRELEELCAAVARIAEIVDRPGAYGWLWDDRNEIKRPRAKVVKIADARRSQPTGKHWTPTDAEREASAIVELLRDLKIWREWGLVNMALEEIKRRARASLQETTNSGRLNWQAVRAVGALQALWERETGKPGPQKALNPSSRFANFLRAGFQFMELKADVRSAFNAWRRWAESA